MSQEEETKSARIAKYLWRIDKAQGCSEVWEIVKTSKNPRKDTSYETLRSFIEHDFDCCCFQMIGQTMAQE